ncbi:MAG: 2-vinyl bacteriochlorophyllide hydratase [Paracoccaceae bacterium]|jgi:3-vinyl bacteriochlorophyllide hydratase|nr:2-vinyl bacteriochlorophyllide hydratase [Marinovum sp.]OUV39782.1 MAG: 2-vinyl bacteriochlorophyllide hydratase [Rhodobacteraceae bacterium TMED111]|tara:strand:+ start:1236 stop:1757 length:522 start_codon:yes stop_codon:yes gene_type:complete
MPIASQPTALGQREQKKDRDLLYTAEEKKRRDETIWTLVQGVLAPLQFFVFLVSTYLVIRYLNTGEGYQIATISVIFKTSILMLIMVTGAIWEKVVFGQYLLAPAFFWEDIVSFFVIFLHIAYVLALWINLFSEQQLMLLALVAYVAYFVNALQFLIKLRAARMQSAWEDAHA